MRFLATTAVFHILIALLPASLVVAQDVAAETATVAQPVVRLLDPGGEPRRELRYHLEVGQTDRSVATTSVASRVQPAEPTWPEPMTLRATTDQTVVGADGDGVFHLETVYTEVELVSGGDDPFFADDSAQVRALAGTTTGQSVDDRGRVLSSETIIGPGWAAAGIHLGFMPGLIDVENLQLSRLLPDEPVGVGASWQVTSEIPSVEGQLLPVVVTTTLDRLYPDGTLEFSSEGRIGPYVQRLTSTPTSDHVALVIRTTGDLSAAWTVDPTSFGPEGHLGVEIVETTTPTAEGVEPWTIALRMATDIEPLAASPSPTTAADPQATPSGTFGRSFLAIRQQSVNPRSSRATWCGSSVPAASWAARRTWAST
jgi:hypothetical protein